MKTRILAAAFRTNSVLSVAALLIPLAATHGQEWRNDIQYVSSTSKTVDDADSSAADDGADTTAECCPRQCNSYSYDPCAELQAEFKANAKCLEQQGIIYAPGLTQFYQGVAGGGNDEEFEYGGKVDQFLILDSCKMGLWQGTTMTMHVETRFGDDVNLEAVGLAPVNVAMLYPKEDEHDTAITGLTFAQQLDDDVQATFGKFNALDLFYSLYPQTGRGINGFMNASMVIPLGVARVVPLSFMGAGLMEYHEKQIEGGILVYDTQNVATTSGFDDLFDNGANILGFWRFFTEMGGLPGSSLFGGIWSTGDFVSFDPAGFVIEPGQGLVVDRQDGAFSLMYILEQTLWMDGCNKKRNVSLLSQWVLSDPETSPFGWSANVGIQGTGFNRCRPLDSFGIGYFHSGLSDDFKTALAPVVNLHDVNGVELYYNAAVTQMFHLTADFQVIEPAEVANDTAIVVGLRGTVGF